MNLTVAESAILDAILDELIPANPQRDIPGAGAAGVATFLQEQARLDASLNAALSSLLRDAQEMANEVSPDLVRQLEAQSPAAFQILLTQTYKGYYSRPDMRAKFGVGVHPVHPHGYAVERETPALLTELTAPVLARGPVFRDLPGDDT
jgi:hypothetical protein